MSDLLFLYITIPRIQTVFVRDQDHISFCLLIHLTLISFKHKRLNWFIKGWTKTYQITAMLNCIFNQFISSSLSQKHIICSLECQRFQFDRCKRVFLHQQGELLAKNLACTGHQTVESDQKKTVYSRWTVFKWRVPKKYNLMQEIHLDL